MKFSAHCLIPLLSLAAACGGAGSSAGTGTATGAVSSSFPANNDAAIVALLYDNSYSVPDGFFVDERAQTDRSYTIHHVLDPSGSYELCSDDFAVATEWEAADNESRSVQGYFVASHESERYFEFARELAYVDDVGNIEDITSPGFARVFKCRNTSRDGVDRTLLSGYAGTINARPVDPDSIRVFSEYLWPFTFFPQSRKKVIGTVASSDENAVRHTLQLAFSTNQGSGNCDLVEIVDWRFSADRDSGEVRSEFDLIRSFNARYEAGLPVICD